MKKMLSLFCSVLLILCTFSSSAFAALDPAMVQHAIESATSKQVDYSQHDDGTDWFYTECQDGHLFVTVYGSDHNSIACQYYSNYYYSNEVLALNICNAWNSQIAFPAASLDTATHYFNSYSQLFCTDNVTEDMIYTFIKISVDNTQDGLLPTLIQTAGAQLKKRTPN